MKVLGIVAEYNPFHNGHLYHLEQSKAACGADCVICVMSGNFIQRGEPAIVEKRARAEMALKAGINLVLELPVVYAMSSAEYFAHAAVKILDSLGAVDYLCFGSESGDLEGLAAIAEVLVQEPQEFKEALRRALAAGNSYPSARETALKACIPEGYGANHLEEIMKSPNNILGIEYLKALKRLNSSILPMTVKRLGNAYNNANLTGVFSSATSIRNQIRKNPETAPLNGLGNLLPPSVLEILEREFSQGRGPVFPEAFDAILLSGLRRMTAAEIRDLPYVSEGLENRIKEAAQNCLSLEGLLDGIGTRRYTDTRIRRALFSILTGMRGGEFDRFNESGGPQYIRILGFDSKGRQLLSEAGGKASLPILTKAADYKNSCNPLLARMLEIEAASTDQYVLAFRSAEYGKSGLEFTGNVIRHMN
jgi:predicted nucleotidyltransferase